MPGTQIQSAVRKRRLACMVLGLYDRVGPGEFFTITRDLSVGVMMLSHDGRVTYVNDRGLTVIGAPSRRAAYGQRFGPDRDHSTYVSAGGAPLTPATCPVCLALRHGGTHDSAYGRRLPGGKVLWYYLSCRGLAHGGALVTAHVVER